MAFLIDFQIHTSGTHKEDSMTATMTERAEREEQLVAFTLGGETYGIDIAAIQEIIRLPEITPIPRTAPDVEGVINLRGKIVPIVDLRARLGLSSLARTPLSRVIVVQVGENTVGLIVDGVAGVLHLPTSSIEPPSELVSAIDENHIRGVGKANDALIILLNVETILVRGTA
jgi:purine-binding chemotaxis protein CheW